MRLVIDLDEKYKNLFFEAVKATKATIVVEESDFWTEYQIMSKRVLKKDAGKPDMDKPSLMRK